MTTVGFSGTRRLPTTAYERVGAIVATLPEGTRVVQGACIGVDSYVAWAAKRRGLHVHAVVPADRSRVPPDWRDWCDTFEEMPAGTDYRSRNARIAGQIDRLIAIPDAAEDAPQSRRSGTWMTVRIARRIGIPVEVYILDE
jgi:NADH:ubiquinone oxidoreductase subunit